MKGVEFLTLKKKKQNNLQHLNVHVHRAVHEMLAYCVTSSLLQFDNDEFSFLMTNIYEYIHYIQSLKSIWTKRMSTWGCYFCCVCVFFFFFFLFFSFGSLSPCEVCVFLKKILNVFQKKKKPDKKSMLIPDIFFFPQKISKMKTKYTKKKVKEQGHFFYLHSGEEKKNPGMETVEHTASTILVVQMVTKN